MDSFFNHDYAGRVREYISKMDDDTAQMFGLFVVHEVHHQHMQDNARTISKRATEVLGEIRDQVAKSLVGRELTDEERATAALVGIVSKSTERKVATPEGAAYYNKPIGSRITGSASRNQGKTKLKITYKGPGTPQDFDITGALSSAPGRANSFQERWNDDGGDPRRTTQRTYNRVAEGGRLMNQLSAPVSRVSPEAGVAMAVGGQVGQFAGEFGPSAEKVVGPAMRKTAYRYRGTERKVDPELVTAINNEVKSQMRDQPTARGQNKLTPAKRAALSRQADQMFANRPEGDTRTLSQIRNEVFTNYQAAGKPQVVELAPEQKLSAAMRQSVNYLRERLPSAQLARLQTSSGKIPPSEGVIIDRNGNVVTQMVGYQEDHFLPFNLKNLKALQGGSYVRTRSAGGLTSEDIHAGLMSGARSVSVVSRSGTFTLHFADDLRGGRRYGDVARQMVDRYEKTLDAVKSRQIERLPMSQLEQAQIRADVEREFASFKGTPEGRAVIEQHVREAIEEAKTSTDLSVRDYEKIEAQVRREMAKEDPVQGRAPDGTRTGAPLPRDPEVRESFIRSRLIEAEKAKKEAKMLQLDGQGYATALQALQEQYPYFIADVEQNTNIYKDPVNKIPSSRETDAGYVRPRYLRPKAVQEGYFDPEIEGYTGNITTREGKPTGKYSAAETNYQNYRSRGRGDRSEGGSTTSEETPRPEGEASGAPATPDRPKGPQDLGQTLMAESVHTDLALSALRDSDPSDLPELRKLLGGEPPESEEGKRNLKRAMRNPENRKLAKEGGEKVAAALARSNASENQLKEYADLLENLRSSTGPSGGKALPEKYEVSPREPAAFEDVPSGKDAQFYKNLQAQLPQYDTFRDIKDDATLRDASDASLDLAKVYERIASSSPQTGDVDEVTRIVADDWNLENEPSLFRRLQASPEQARARAEQLRERSRAIERNRRILAEWNATTPSREESRSKAFA